MSGIAFEFKKGVLSPNSSAFEFKKGVLGPNSFGAIQVTVPPEVLMDKPFPPGPITLEKTYLEAPGAKGGIVFGGDGEGKGGVEFRGTASSSLRVNEAPEKVVKELGLTGPFAAGLSLSAAGKGPWITLQETYAAQAAAEGAVPLGVCAQVAVGADAERSGAFAILHRFEPADSARKVLEDLFASWQLPRQVSTAGDVQPGTWLITEVDGSLAVKLGVRYGYLFNWLRQIKGGLSGDIGLRLQLGLEAKVGLTATDRYALIVSRPTADAVLRLQLFRQGTKGWDVAADAGVGARGDLGELAAKTPEELLRAILNVHESQVLSDLQEWLDPEKSLSAMLSKAGVDYAKQFLTKVTGIDAMKELAKARERLSGLLGIWKTLDQRAASALWARLGDEEDIKEVLDLAKQIKDTLGDEELRTLLEGEITKLNFQTTAAGKWLSAHAPGMLLQLLTDSGQLQRLRTVAEQAAAILSEEELLKVARGLKKVIGDRLCIDKIVNAVDPESLDAWLQGRLTEFLGKNPAAQDLNEIKKAINELRKKGADLYKKTTKALEHQYRADFASSYQRTGEHTALLDVELDFGKSQDSVRSLLLELLNGKLDRLFLDDCSSMRGVTLKKAVLTHEIRRELHIDLTLPGTGAEMWHENTGFGSIEALQDGGRLLLFEGTDEAHFATAKMHRDSRLSLAAQLPEPTQPGTGLRRYEKASLTYSYSFHQAKKDMGTGEFKAQVGAYADKYLDWQFPPGAFSLWANELERKAAKAGGGKLGNTLIALELVVPPAVGKAWLDKAPAMGSDLCLTMSVNLQNALKELIPFYYFQDMNRYKNVEAVAPLLVWAAIPAKKEDGLHWNYPDKETVREKVNSWETQQRLTAALGKIYVALDKAGLSEVAKIYHDDRKPADLCDFALGGGYEYLKNLLNHEAQIVRGAAKAADKLANFRGHREWGPERAIKALAELAGCLAEAFNGNVWSVYGKGALRPLGTLLFTEAARAFDPENPELAPKGGSALLRVEILEPSVPFPPAGFPNHGALAKDQVLVEQMVVSSALALSSPRTPGTLLNEGSEAPAELVYA